MPAEFDASADADGINLAFNIVRQTTSTPGEHQRMIFGIKVNVGVLDSTNEPIA